MAGEQPGIKRRVTIVELPVLRIVGQSLWLPFRYLRELAKYGWIPFLLSLGANAINFLIVREDAPKYVSQIWMMAAHFALFTPFSVTWTKLAIYGREAIANDPPFAYSRTVWLYLLATILMMVSITIIAAPPLALLRYGQANFDNQLVAAAGVLSIAAIFLVALGFFRIAAFVFPAIAIGKYAGLSAAWKQTAGNLGAARRHCHSLLPSVLHRSQNSRVGDRISSARSQGCRGSISVYATGRDGDDRARRLGARIQHDRT